MDDHEGLAKDLERMALLERRQMLRLLLGASLVPLVGCGSDDDGTDAATEGDSTSGGECTIIPPETAGPYPGDGSNGPDALSESGIARRDIRTSFGAFSGTALGIELTIRLRILEGDCVPSVGRAVYVWHCDRNAAYSLYTLPGQNYLRGTQVTDANGEVSFTSIFPAAYPGRWPHVHFEVFDGAHTDGVAPIATSQLALPEAACAEVYATEGYENSPANLAAITLETDGVFRDGSSQQLATVTGNVTDGYVATLEITVSA